MKRYFTHYWTNKTWDDQASRIANESEKTLNHTASNMFQDRGISKGDGVYVVTVKQGQLFLLCKLTVGKVCGFEEAARHLKDENLWEADDHIVAESPAPIRSTFEVPLPLAITEQLRFEGSEGSKSLRFVEPGVLHQQTLRGVRELDYGSAQLLDAILSAKYASLAPGSRGNPDWTQDEHILALDLYFRFNPNKISKTHTSVVELSHLLNRLPIHPQALRGETFRNPDSVYMKLCNFLRLDPSYKGKGLSAGSKGEEVAWNMYAGNRSEFTKIVEAITASGERQISQRLTQPLDDDDEAFPEGRVLTREHKTRERNGLLVERKKKAVLVAKGNLECEACGFDFFKTYHELGREYAECHHLAPLSDLREERKTKLSELGIVCANCHRMLHRARPWKTIGELKAIIAEE